MGFWDRFLLTLFPKTSTLATRVFVRKPLYNFKLFRPISNANARICLNLATYTPKNLKNLTYAVLRPFAA